MAEPCLHRANVDSGAKPAGRGGIAEAMEVPLGVMQLGSFCHVLAEETDAIDFVLLTTGL